LTCLPITTDVWRFWSAATLLAASRASVAVSARGPFWTKPSPTWTLWLCAKPCASFQVMVSMRFTVAVVASSGVNFPITGCLCSAGRTRAGSASRIAGGGSVIPGGRGNSAFGRGEGGVTGLVFAKGLGLILGLHDGLAAGGGLPGSVPAAGAIEHRTDPTGIMAGMPGGRSSGGCSAFGPSFLNSGAIDGLGRRFALGTRSTLLGGGSIFG